jgi:hypothetical protein
MGQLPFARITVARPFLITGIYYVGPFELKSGSDRSKTATTYYAKLCICTAIKALHLKMVRNLTS